MGLEGGSLASPLPSPGLQKCAISPWFAFSLPSVCLQFPFSFPSVSLRFAFGLPSVSHRFPFGWRVGLDGAWEEGGRWVLWGGFRGSKIINCSETTNLLW